MKKNLKWVVIVLLVIAAVAAFGWQWWQKQQSQLPVGISTGNGRIEASEVDITAKYPGRVLELLANEGDIVPVGKTLVVMDTLEPQARLDRAKADLKRELEVVKEAEVQVAKSKTDLRYVQQQYDRVVPLLDKGLVAQSIGDQRRNERDVASAAIRAAEARLNTTQTGIGIYRATVRQIEAELAESRLTSPVIGRVLYKLMQKGEVLGAGGKVMTLLDLSSVYMEIFLPAADAGVLKIGSEAKIVLDAAPDQAIPARVTFVSPQAQFTPKQVETRSERDKLMFRVKLEIPTKLVLEHIDRVKTGLRGMGYVRSSADIPWPAFLDSKLAGAAK